MDCINRSQNIFLWWYNINCLQIQMLCFAFQTRLPLCHMHPNRILVSMIWYTDDLESSITVTSLWARWRLKSQASRLLAQSFVQAQIKENVKAPRHWPLWGESTGDRWIPLTKGQWHGKYFHSMTSSCSVDSKLSMLMIKFHDVDV